jgi:hypothetical protein
VNRKKVVSEYVTGMRSKLLQETIAVLKRTRSVMPEDMPSNAWEDFKSGAAFFGEPCSDLFQDHVEGDIMSRLEALDEPSLMLLWSHLSTDYDEEEDEDDEVAVSHYKMIEQVYDDLREELDQISYSEGPFDWDDEIYDARPQGGTALLDYEMLVDYLGEYGEFSTDSIFDDVSDESIDTVIEMLHEHEWDHVDLAEREPLATAKRERLVEEINSFLSEWRRNLRVRIREAQLR